MSALPPVCRAVARELRAHLRGEAREWTLFSLRRALPARLRWVVSHLLPQPDQFAPEVSRDVVRHGVRWNLHPHEVVQWMAHFGVPDPNLSALCAIAQGAEAVIDVGANVGIYALSVARLARPGRLLAVEPHPRTHAALAANLALNPGLKVELAEVALCEQAGELTLHEYGAMSSGLVSAHRRHDLATTRSLSVKATTLDLLVSERKLRAVGAIKIDVEGYEPDVILGAAEVLGTQRPALAVEWTPTWSEGRAASLRRAVTLLQRLEYVPHRITPTGADERPEVWEAMTRGGQSDYLLLPSERASRLVEHVNAFDLDRP